MAAPSTLLSLSWADTELDGLALATTVLPKATVRPIPAVTSADLRKRFIEPTLKRLAGKWLGEPGVNGASCQD